MPQRHNKDIQAPTTKAVGSRFLFETPTTKAVGSELVTKFKEGVSNGEIHFKITSCLLRGPLCNNHL